MAEALNALTIAKGETATNKELDPIGKVQTLYLCHCSRRDDIVQQLKDKGCAYMQLAVDK